MNPIIRAEDLSKEYRIGAVQGSYSTLRESLMATVRTPFRRRRAASRTTDPTVWALKDVSFEVQPGEVVGVIGRNGAGKSTLLKILSRITDPTRGRARIRGRVGSLLEVGTGFHPELTGRENIFLNGAILGMKRSEIARKFEEIVAFAEVERFVDTPVKHYSSGMYLRLAFAVAAQLEPDILLIDEVLAVGDASFQRKCLKKMEDVGQQGRTVLFISHNITAITRLCGRAILLDEGRIVRDGPTHEVSSMYLRSDVGTTAAREWLDPATRPGNDIVRLRAVRVRTEAGRITEAIDIRKAVGIEMEFEVLKSGHVLVPNYHFYNEEGVLMFMAGEHDVAWRRKPRPLGRFSTTAWIPGNFLSEGMIIVSAAISTLDPVTLHVFERDAVAFHVIDGHGGDSARGDYGGTFPGVIRPLLNWTTHFSAPEENVEVRT
jgi:homopolymeric O-antigen transport system ATP-binding protein